MRKVDVFIETIENSGNYSKIELFNDEEITVSSSIQNIQDISKIFTDYSQSFTVPSSPVNNAIFEHFYNNDVDTVLDHNLRRNAYIEVDYIPFRTGKIQLEKAMVKNNQNENYSITFYGETLSLKDKFGETKLKDLDYSFVNSTYSGNEVQTRITSSSDYDVRYPLISSERLWSYGDSTSTDISIVGGRIDYTELFPALKISKIFEAIETKFSLDFQGLFLSNPRFTNCFLYCKNKETFEVFTTSQRINITSYDTSYNNILGHTLCDTTLDTIRITNKSVNSGLVFSGSNLDVIISGCTSLSAIYYIDVYKNGTLYNTIVGSGNNTYGIYSVSNKIVDETFYCVVKSNLAVTFNVQYLYNKNETEKEVLGGGSVKYKKYNYIVPIYCSQVVLSNATIDLSSFMPDMTVYDFVSGIFKNFNLTCYAKSKDVFQIETLEDWYNRGVIIDITQYTTTEEISVSRVPLYKSIKFEHEQSQSFMNREFFDLFGREYGDLNNTFDYDGGEYLIKLPFENLLHQEFDGTMTQVGYCLTKAPDFKPYIPKPILLYMYEQQSTSIKFYDGVSTNTLTTYMPFGQDMKQYSTNYSLNWGADNSSLLNVPITQGKYATYYYGYLSNLFSKKNRITNVKTILPLSILTSLKLNDRLIIRDKRYIINQMNSKLTNGEVNLELINDFRPIDTRVPIIVSNEGQPISTAVILPNGAIEATVSSIEGIDITPSTVTSDQYITITTTTNTDVNYTRITEDGNIRVTETFSNRITEGAGSQLTPYNTEYTFKDGSTQIDTNYIIQQ